MGVMRFAVPSNVLNSWKEYESAFLRGIDGRVFPTTVSLVGEELQCRRPLSDSCKLSVPWNVEGIGTPILTTTSLRERDEPYSLVLELARGKLAEVRDQWSIWEMAKMVVPDKFREVQAAAFKKFAHASSVQHDEAKSQDSAQQAIRLACEAASLLANTYIVQRMSSIRRSSKHPPSLLGTALDETVLKLDQEQILGKAFTTASVPVCWENIEPEEGQYNWSVVDKLVACCTQNRLICRGGPLINLGPGGLPKWLAPWKNDFLNLPSFVCDFVDTAVSRYVGLIRIWEVSAGGNTGGAMELNEEQRLSLVARTLETALRTDSDSQFFIRIEQPWGEYQKSGEQRLSPFQFVDALIRSNLGLHGITLNINAGFTYPGCLSRDLLSVSKLIDLWSILGVQIHINLACPSSDQSDPLADQNISVRNVLAAPWDEEIQAEWFERMVPMLMAKPSVTGVYVEQFSDAVPHRFPNAGLLNSSSEPKKMLTPIQRQDFR